MAHAALDFAVTHPDLTSDWHAASNTLVVLAVPDELSLRWLCGDARAAGLRVAAVHEPDLGGALTAAAVEPAGRKLVRGLPLALDRAATRAAPVPAAADSPPQLERR